MRLAVVYQKLCKIVLYIFFQGKMRYFRTKNPIQVTPLAYDVLSVSKLRYTHLGRILKDH